MIDNRLIMKHSVLIQISILLVLTSIFSNCTIENDNNDLIIQSFVDKTGKFEYHDLIKLENSKWKVLQNNSASFGFTDSKIWLKVSNINSDIGFIDFSHTQLDRIGVSYKTKQNSIKHKMSGDILPFDNRKIKTNTFIFNIADKADSPLLINAQSSGTLLLSFNLIKNEDFISQLQVKSLLFGVFFGFLILVSLYNFLLFVMIRDSTFMWYAIYVFFAFLAAFALEGYGYQYFWFNSPEFQMTSVPFFGILIYLPGIQFTKQYLFLKDKFKLLVKQ